MTTVEIGRLHARYLGDTAVRAAELDSALHRLAEDDLEAEVAGVRLPDAFAVCVPEITVAVRLDACRPVASTSRDWARAIVDAVRQRLDDGRGVVAYAREVDALDDVVRSSAAQDWTRRWAWVQSGLVERTFPGPAPYGGAVAETLAGYPEWVATVLVRGGAEAGRVLGPSDWVRLADLVRQAVGGPGPRTLPSDATIAVTPATSTGRGVPAVVWAEVRDVAERWDLAVLTVAMTDPARSRDARAVTAVLAAAPEAGPGASPDAGQVSEPSAGETVTDRADHSASSKRLDQPESGVESYDARAGVGSLAVDPGLELAASTEVGSPTERSGRAPEPEQPDEPEEPEVRTSQWGGVLYCIHAMTALGLVEEVARSEPVGADMGVALDHVLSAVTGAPPDDPAVLAAAGCRLELEVPEPLTADASERRDARAGAVRAWVAERLGEPGNVDLTWVWRRTVTLESEPGWLDATFPLSSVDLRLRIAGLDLDPGHVWWLGGVVRFHHV